MRKFKYDNIQGSVSTRKQWAAHNRRKKSRNGSFRVGIIIFLCFLLLILIAFCVILFIRVSGHRDEVEPPVVLAEKNRETEEPTQETTTEYVWSDAVNGLPSEQEVLEEGRKVVYLTFDDGPSRNTDRILDVLKENRVKATFFTVGKENYDDEYKRIVAEGHTIGMHSYSHDYGLIYSSVEAFDKDFNKISDHIENITGVKPTLYRFPGGSSNTVSDIPMEMFIRYLNDRNIIYYDWNALAGDAEGKEISADDMIDRIIQDVKKYDVSVVLLHDTNVLDTTVDMLPELIKRLRALGAEMLPITSTSTVIQHVVADSVK